MSKSGSRYGRRSNWFKIHCLLQEQNQQEQNQIQQQLEQLRPHYHPSVLREQQLQHQLAQQQRRPTTSPSTQRRGDENIMLGLDEYKNSTSPNVSSPSGSSNSDGSVEISERSSAISGHSYRPPHPLPLQSLPLNFHLGMPLLPPPFLSPSSITLGFSPYHLYGPQGASHPLVMHTASNMLRHTPGTPAIEEVDSFSRSSATTTVTTDPSKPSTSTANTDLCDSSNNNDEFYPNPVCDKDRAPTPKPRSPENRILEMSPERMISLPQDDPIDLSMKTQIDEDSDTECLSSKKPIDLTTKP